MAGTFPNMTCGKTTRTPARHIRRNPTGVIVFGDDSEQRWVMAPQMNAFEVTLTDISGEDMSRILEFFRSQKGAFDSTFSFPFNGVTYNYCTFDHDEIEWSEGAKPETFSCRLRLHQVRQD